MVASLKFYPSVGGQEITGTANINTVQAMVYEDGTGNKYTLDFSAISTPQGIPKLQYLSKGGVAGTDEIDFSNLTQLVSSIGAINTNVGTIGTNVNTINTNVGTIETAVGNGNGSLGKALGELDTKVGLVKVKTDHIPADLITELAPLTAAAGKIAIIEGKANLIPTNFQTRLNALDPAGTTAGSLGATLKEIKDKTEKLDLTDANAQGTLGEALGKLAKADQLPADFQTRFNALDPTSTDTGSLGKVLKGIQDKTDPIPTNLTARLDALNPDASNPASLLGKTLKEIKDKTDNLDPEDTAQGTLGKALETISAEATANLNALNALKALLNALNPDASSKSLLSATLKAIKDKTDKLDLENTAADSGTLGGALNALGTTLTGIDGNTTEMSRELKNYLQGKGLGLDKGQGLDMSSAGNEDMLGMYSSDQFLG